MIYLNYAKHAKLAKNTTNRFYIAWWIQWNIGFVRVIQNVIRYTRRELLNVCKIFFNSRLPRKDIAFLTIFYVDDSRQHSPYNFYMNLRHVQAHNSCYLCRKRVVFVLAGKYSKPIKKIRKKVVCLCSSRRLYRLLYQK